MLMARDLEIALLRSFVTAVRAGSISRAATTLGHTQPALSQQLRKLESAVGRPLLLPVTVRRLADPGGRGAPAVRRTHTLALRTGTHRNRTRAYRPLRRRSARRPRRVPTPAGPRRPRPAAPRRDAGGAQLLQRRDAGGLRRGPRPTRARRGAGHSRAAALDGTPPAGLGDRPGCGRDCRSAAGGAVLEHMLLAYVGAGNAGTCRSALAGGVRRATAWSAYSPRYGPDSASRRSCPRTSNRPWPARTRTPYPPCRTSSSASHDTHGATVIR